MVRIAAAFGDLVDLKTPFTHGHSGGVADLAAAAAERARLDPLIIRQLHVAARLHDVGRAGVSNAVWEKHGARVDRPKLARLLDYARLRDTLVVWKLDRLARSLRHLIDLDADLEGTGVGLRSLREEIDTTPAGGRLVFAIFGALAEFERELIRERTRRRAGSGQGPGLQRRAARQVAPRRSRELASTGPKASSPSRRLPERSASAPPPSTATRLPPLRRPWVG